MCAAPETVTMSTPNPKMASNHVAYSAVACDKLVELPASHRAESLQRRKEQRG